jgi:hypothetical protein
VAGAGLDGAVCELAERGADLAGQGIYLFRRDVAARGLVRVCCEFPGSGGAVR